MEIEFQVRIFEAETAPELSGPNSGEDEGNDANDLREYKQDLKLRQASGVSVFFHVHDERQFIYTCYHGVELLHAIDWSERLESWINDPEEEELSFRLEPFNWRESSYNYGWTFCGES